MKFVVNHNTKVYHHVDCHCVPQILKENMSETESRPPFYRPCSKCRPEIDVLEMSETFTILEVEE